MTKNIFIRNVDENAWLEYQIKAKREGTSAAEKIRRHINEATGEGSAMRSATKKYWIRHDRQGEVGAWPADTPDKEIEKELEEQGLDVSQGEIVAGEWTDTP